MSTPQPPQSVTVDPKGTPAAGTPPTGPTPGTPAQPPRHEGPGRVKRTARQVKQALLVVIGALIAAFAISNRDEVRVRWIFGDPVSTPLILVIAIALVAGLVLGWIIAKLSGRNSD